MKKHIIKITFIATLTLSIGYSIQNNRIEASINDLALDNIEALASGERETSVSCEGNGSAKCPLDGKEDYYKVTIIST